MQLKDNVGILGLGIYIPENYITAKEIAEATQGVWTEEAVIKKLGIKKKPIPGKEDGTQEAERAWVPGNICEQQHISHEPSASRHPVISSAQLSPAAQSRPTLCNPMNRSTPGSCHQNHINPRLFKSGELLFCYSQMHS